MEKMCTKCKQVKKLCDFHKANDRAGKYYSNCKKCKLNRQRSLNSHFRSAFKNIEKRLRRQNSYKNRKLTFNWQEFQVFKNDYKKLHAQWAKNNYKRNLTPSVDRIDNNKDYTMDNIQIITVHDNIKKDLNNKGSRNGRSRLIAFQVEAIRWLYANFDFTQMELARMFGVKHPQISSIIRRKSWSHIK